MLTATVTAGLATGRAVQARMHPAQPLQDVVERSTLQKNHGSVNQQHWQNALAKLGNKQSHTANRVTLQKSGGSYTLSYSEPYSERVDITYHFTIQKDGRITFAQAQLTTGEIQKADASHANQGLFYFNNR